MVKRKRAKARAHRDCKLSNPVWSARSAAAPAAKCSRTGLPWLYPLTADRFAQGGGGVSLEIPYAFQNTAKSFACSAFDSVRCDGGMILNEPALRCAIPTPSPEFADEHNRLRVLQSFAPDALEDDPELSAIVQFAAQLCDVPVALVSLVDDVQQRFIAREGIEERETPREVSFCAHTMLKPEMMEIKDTAKDERFASNPMVTGAPGVGFYAGQPLISDEGAPLGSLCVIDLKARPDGLSDLQQQGLAVLAQAVMRRLNSQRENLQAKQEIAKREEQLRRVIEGVPQIAWSADADGNFDYFNARWTQITGGLPPKTADDWRPYIHEEDAPEVFAEWTRCVAQGTEFEVEYRLRQDDGSYAWILAQALPVTEPGSARRWFGTITDIDEVYKALESRDMLAKELSHRIKNIFAVVIGLAKLKAGKAPEHKPFADDLAEILHALSRAHDFVRPSGGPVQESLQGLLTALFAPYRDNNGQPRIKLTGIDATITARAATPLALVFHELATNSAKYGALSNGTGYVELVAQDQGDDIALTWAEHDGPPVTGEGERGFGSRLIEMSVTGQLQGSWERKFQPDGLVMELTVSKQAIAA